ncbi:putative gamma-glutamylcyclotransferase At3g02910 isoform X2 [Zingiber officinale]|uniref:putative gamma-glutamylcyclotransferase At3g02910 isoform X2 n=1 Tax=Zingiber officinale TaxID=94328 RepID=UPI001C4CF6DE|nr:putative gamma-glutamylcyclotransferase At3g02910 isoform X2 [Zingiber officinale]
MDLDRTALVFVYGTLKRRFPNHSLLADLAAAGDASFLTFARTARRFPLVIGPLSIPFLLRLPGFGRRVDGELYAVSSRGLSRLDELEGTTRGHYDRIPLVVVPFTPGADGDEARDSEEGEDAPGAVTAEAYFAHPSIGDDLWRRCGERGLGSYTEDDASGYVPPKDRPAGTTFLGEGAGRGLMESLGDPVHQSQVASSIFFR